MTQILLRITLALTGIVLLLLGLNTGVGGILTLGWQIPPDFATIANAGNFAAQDNHVRFMGGLLAGAGLLTCAGAVALHRLRPALITICAIVFVGGLFRFTPFDGTVFSNPELIRSLALELVYFPLLALWVWRTAPKG